VRAERIILFATGLGLAGLLVLIVHTNLLAAALALFGLLAYVIPYGYFKRRTRHGTLVGSISGAMPPVVGYVSVTGRIDAAAVVLFLILVTWQMPHFFAIAIYRARDYASARIPVLPAVRGVSRARAQMIGWTVAFILSCSALTLMHYTGPIYEIVVLVIGVYWLVVSLTRFTSSDPDRWARRMFRSSLAVLMVLCLVISLDNVIR
jgi:protoheme IX farnesyltransferase